MTRGTRFGVTSMMLMLLFCSSIAALAQQKAQNVTRSNRSYDPARETALQGTVVSYSISSVAPLGPHAVIQTASGPVDVHLGNAKLLEANHFTVSPGDSVRILGEDIVFGSSTQFVARVIQKGNQSLVLRSPRGFPLRSMVKGSGSRTSGLAGVL